MSGINTNDVTVFKNIHNTDVPHYKKLSSILDRIKNGTSKDKIAEIRKEKDKSKRNELKKDLPSICFSGEFKRRADDAIIRHSGIICLDFDDYTTNKQMSEERERLCKDKYVLAVFASPSNKGLKVLVKIPADIDNHKNYFNSLQKHFKSEFFDPTSKNISRVCYESYDPSIYINYNSSVWDKIEEPEYRKVSKLQDKPTIPVTDKDDIIKRLKKWWEKNYPMGEGARNNNVYVLAAAFNRFGVDKADAMLTLHQYAESGFGTKEIDDTIESAYRKSEENNTEYFEDEDKVNAVKAKLKRGVDRQEIRKQMSTKHGLQDDVVDSVIERVENEKTQFKFWYVTDKGVVKVDEQIFKFFLEDNGIYRYYPEGGKVAVFVKVTSNLVEVISESFIKDFVLSYLLDLDNKKVYNYFVSTTKLFKEDFLGCLDPIDVHFVRDTKDEAYIYFENCAVQVTKKGHTVVDYVDLGGYVWKEHVINRIYTDCKVKNSFDYKRFIENVCGKDEDRVTSMRSTIGYMMHSYKHPAYCPAVILNDEDMSKNPEGGTGKGLIVESVAQLKKVVKFDAKSFDPQKTFAYQLVSSDTQLMCFDDVTINFNFEYLFSIITEGLTLEKKNKDAIKIPFNKSPKVVITTNYAVKGEGSSHNRRRWEVELTNFYSDRFTPFEDFGRGMFTDWNDSDYCQFDRYMINCLKLYLKEGLIKTSHKGTSKERKLMAETNEDFIYWTGVLDEELNDKIKIDEKLHNNELMQDFIDQYPEYNRLSRPKFYSWLDKLSYYLVGNEPRVGRDATGKWILIKKKK